MWSDDMRKVERKALGAFGKSEPGTISIPLSQFQNAFADMVGIKRDRRAKERGEKDTHGMSPDKDGKNHRLGARGEYAFALHSGKLWKTFIPGGGYKKGETKMDVGEGDNDIDIGGRYEIRSTDHEDGGLMVYGTDYQFKVCVAVRLINPKEIRSGGELIRVDFERADIVGKKFAFDAQRAMYNYHCSFQDRDKWPDRMRSKYLSIRRKTPKKKRGPAFLVDPHRLYHIDQMMLASPQFEHRTLIRDVGKKGVIASPRPPALLWEGASPLTLSYALVCRTFETKRLKGGRRKRGGEGSVHWIVYNVTRPVTGIKRERFRQTPVIDEDTVKRFLYDGHYAVTSVYQMQNDYGYLGYAPLGSRKGKRGTREVEFRLYALRRFLNPCRLKHGIAFFENRLMKRAKEKRDVLNTAVLVGWY